MSSLDWRSLQYFGATVRSGSILRAATILGVTTRTVRSSIDRLEDHYGRRLVRRTHGGIELTAAGRDVYAKVAEASNKIDRIATTEQRTNEQEPNCRVSCSVIFFRSVLADLVDELTQLESAIHFMIDPTDSLRNLYDEEIDISIRHQRPVQETFVAVEVGTLKLVLFAPRDSNNLEDALSKYPYASVPEERDFASSIGFERMYEKIHRRISFQSYGHLSEIVQQGRFVGMLPEAIGNQYGNLKRIAPEMKPVVVPVWICRKRTTANYRTTERGFLALRTVIEAALTEDSQQVIAPFM